MPATSVSTRPSINIVGTLPSGLMARNSGVCVSFLASETDLPSNGAPTSCRAICGAIELAPGLKYKVSIAVLPLVDHESAIWPKDTLDFMGSFGLRREDACAAPLHLPTCRCV